MILIREPPRHPHGIHVQRNENQKIFYTDLERIARIGADISDVQDMPCLRKTIMNPCFLSLTILRLSLNIHRNMKNKGGSIMEFAGENKWQWLRPYGALARWVGWMLIFFGVCYLAGIAFLIYFSGDGSLGDGLILVLRGFLFTSPLLIRTVSAPVEHALLHGGGMLRSFLFLAPLALGVGQFLRWLVDRDIHPGWLLRNGPRLLILAAVFYLIPLGMFIWHLSNRSPWINNQDPQSQYLALSVIALTTGTSLILRIAPVIILFGLAEALRRMGPIIDESKSTV